jgi:hypothetical protein
MAEQNQVQDDGYVTAGETVGANPVTATADVGPDYLLALYKGRPKNPLSEFATFTYKLILYMVTAEAYIRFIESPNQVAHLIKVKLLELTKTLNTLLMTLVLKRFVTQRQLSRLPTQ